MDIHLHVTNGRTRKQGGMIISNGGDFVAHLKKLGIEKGIIMSSGEGA